MDLFGTALLPGLATASEIVSLEEEATLISGIDDTPLSPFRFQGWEGKRLTQSSGWHYDFTSGRVARAEPIPDWLLPLRRRMAAFAGLAADELI